MTEIVNRVANSSISMIDLEKYYRQEERVLFDLKDFLYEELILREKDFRSALKAVDWESFKEKLVAVTCTVDAIIPNWAYILVGTYLTKYEVTHVIGNMEVLEHFLFEKALSNIDPKDYDGLPVVIKGCSKFPVPMYAYGRVVSIVQPYARSIMYGEPCSTVPLYKKSK